jgi:hypothetical protein
VIGHAGASIGGLGGFIMAASGDISGAVVSGVFLLINTGLTLWVTPRLRERRRRRDDDQAGD